MAIRDEHTVYHKIIGGKKTIYYVKKLIIYKRRFADYLHTHTHTSSLTNKYVTTTTTTTTNTTTTTITI